MYTVRPPAGQEFYKINKERLHAGRKIYKMTNERLPAGWEFYKMNRKDCPQSNNCLPENNQFQSSEPGEACEEGWYINFVTGMQPADQGYPDNCPQNCSVSWGEEYGYDIPGCTNGQCVDYVNCVCQSGFYDADCSKMCPGGSTDPCSGNGQCDDGADGDGDCRQVSTTVLYNNLLLYTNLLLYYTSVYYYTGIYYYASIYYYTGIYYSASIYY